MASVPTAVASGTRGDMAAPFVAVVRMAAARTAPRHMAASMAAGSPVADTAVRKAVGKAAGKEASPAWARGGGRAVRLLQIGGDKGKPSVRTVPATAEGSRDNPADTGSRDTDIQAEADPRGMERRAGVVPPAAPAAPSLSPWGPEVVGVRESSVLARVRYAAAAPE